MRVLADLVVPVACGGCGAPGTRWCRSCARQVQGLPARVWPRRPPAAPVWVVGPYEGPLRAAIVAMKAGGRHDLVDVLGAAVGGAVGALRELGEVEPAGLAPLALVPVPSRPLVARLRGADLTRQLCAAADRSLGGAQVRPALAMRWGVRDSAGLSAEQRRANIAGRVVPRRGRRGLEGACVVLVDDVVTTGATASECVRVLNGSGARVRAVVALAAA